MGTGVGSMPRRKQPLKRRTFIKFYVSATLVLAALALGQFSRYVNTTVKPTLLTAAVQQSLAALPKTDYLIPFGSLTNNSLLSGLGPGWEFTLQPQGYVQGVVRETAESLSINTTRCTAMLELTVTVNMVLDGRTATLTVTDTVPLASVLICGDTPSAYASNFD